MAYAAVVRLCSASAALSWAGSIRTPAYATTYVDDAVLYLDIQQSYRSSLLARLAFLRMLSECYPIGSLPMSFLVDSCRLGSLLSLEGLIAPGCISLVGIHIDI